MGEPVAAMSGMAGTPAPAKGHVLGVLSSASTIQLSNGSHQKTGHFLVELVEPLQAVLNAGYAVEVVQCMHAYMRA
jgi:hypothetical protein